MLKFTWRTHPLHSIHLFYFKNMTNLGSEQQMVFIQCLHELEIKFPSWMGLEPWYSGKTLDSQFWVPGVKSHPSWEFNWFRTINWLFASTSIMMYFKKIINEHSNKNWICVGGINNNAAIKNTMNVIIAILLLLPNKIFFQMLNAN